MTVATVHTEPLPGFTAQGTCQLVVAEGKDAGRAVRLDRRRVVGTLADCDLVLADATVSRRHASVEPVDGHFLVTDLGSNNGVAYEGSLVREARVPAGATLRLGNTFLRIRPEARPLEVEPSRARRFGELVGESLAMREVFAVLELAAQSDVTVLLEGETGTGKELAARAVHEGSARRKGPFVAIDCSALPENLVESELFGHVRGAFTGAAQTRAGAFARADGGTLFLDELGDVPLSTQARLLRVLEERKVRAVGSDAERPVDVRVVGASQHDLSTHVADGRFRADLFYRLSVLTVHLPPLRARREDVATLTRELLRRRGFPDADVAGPNLDALVAHDWPGNVRELRNVVERALALSPGARSFGELRLGLDGAAAADALQVQASAPFAEAKQAVVDAFERVYLRALLARAEGNLSAASRLSGVDRKHLRKLLRKHGLVSAG